MKPMDEKLRSLINEALRVSYFGTENSFAAGDAANKIYDGLVKLKEMTPDQIKVAQNNLSTHVVSAQHNQQLYWQINIIGNLTVDASELLKKLVDFSAFIEKSQNELVPILNPQLKECDADYIHIEVPLWNFTRTGNSIKIECDNNPQNRQFELPRYFEASPVRNQFELLSAFGFFDGEDSNDIVNRYQFKKNSRVAQEILLSNSLKLTSEWIASLKKTYGL
jgi:hypothetical protein